MEEEKLNAKNIKLLQVNNPIFQNYLSKMSYVSVWIVVIIIQTGAVYWLTNLKTIYIFSDSFVFNTILSGLLIPIWYSIHYNRWKESTLYINILLNIAIALILIGIWLITAYLFMRLLFGNDPEYIYFLNRSLVWKTTEGILFYIIMVLIYYLCDNKEEMAEKTSLTLISVKDRRQIHLIPIQEINYIEASGDYVNLHTEKGSFLKEQTMKFLEENLPSQQFVRIHRSYIVNVNNVAKIELYEKESYRVYLKNGQFLKASTTGYKILKATIHL